MMDELKVEAAVASNETLYQTGCEPIIWVVLRGDELVSVHMTEEEANLTVRICGYCGLTTKEQCGDAVRQRFVEWVKNVQEINEREDAGESISSDDWAWSDDDAVEIMQMMAELLGWTA